MIRTTARVYNIAILLFFTWTLCSMRTVAPPNKHYFVSSHTSADFICSTGSAFEIFPVMLKPGEPSCEIDSSRGPSLR